MSAPVDWSGLPESLLVYIMQLLPPAAMRRARLACKAWAQLTPGPAMANRQHLTLSGPLTDCSAALTAALQRSSGLTSLALLQPVSYEDLEYVAFELVRLTSLACCVYNTRAHQPQLATLAVSGHLRSLHVTCVDYHSQRGGASPLFLELAGLSNLVSLQLVAILPVSLSAARGLTDLLIDCGCQAHNMEAHADLQLKSALPVLTQLRSLQICDRGGCLEHLSWASLEHLSALTALTRLHLPDSSICGAWLSRALPHLSAIADLRCSDLWERSGHEAVPAVSLLTTVTALQLTQHAVPEPLGPWLTSLPRLSHLRLRIVYASGGPGGLAALSALTALTALTLGIDSHPVFCASLAHLSSLTQLRRLSLQVYSLFLTQPPCLPLLAKLDISQASNPADWLPSLAAQLPRLHSLALNACDGQRSAATPGSGTTDRALRQHLPACTALEELALCCRCKGTAGAGATTGCVDAAGLACLEALPQLAHLHLREAHAAPPSAARPRPVIERLAQTSSGLRRLTLYNAGIGDRDYAALASLRSLEAVVFRRYEAPGTPTAQLCRPPTAGPGLAALLSAGCKVANEQLVFASGV